MKSLIAVVVGCLTLMGCKTAEPQPETQPSVEATDDKLPTPADTTVANPLDAALAHPGRSSEERARDSYRHPKETLTFFEVEPDDEVLELWAGGGWYTHILAPYLAENGKLHITAYSKDNEREYLRDMRGKVDAYLAEHGFAEKVSVIDIDVENLEFGLDGQADVVLTFRNVHNWVKGGYDKQVYAQAFKALKPGGTFGVVEHRGPQGMTREESATTGYMDETVVIADVESVGFELVAKSDVNANPKDTKDHPEGVWTLPPALRLKEKDQDKYLAIGESDRMTLKFVKPASDAKPE